MTGLIKPCRHACTCSHNTGFIGCQPQLCFSLCHQGVVQLAIALSEEPEDHIQAAAAWALGQIGRHTPEHAKAVAVANVLPKLLQCYLRADASEDLQTKVRLHVLLVGLILCHRNRFLFTGGGLGGGSLLGCWSGNYSVT